jgi:hypothetical protein
LSADSPYGSAYEGYRFINDDDFGTPIQKDYFLLDDEAYSLSGIVQRESSERSLVGIFGTVSTKGFDRDDACVIFEATDNDNYATAGDVGFFTLEGLNNNDC